MGETIYRIRTGDFAVVESKTGKGWKKSHRKFPEAMNVAKLFKAHKNLRLIKDSKSPKFLKGNYSWGEPRGARINFLPNGEKLNKAYSLFAPQLVVHDETSNLHWDVIYQNPNGNFAYLYTEMKIKKSSIKKFATVEEFDKCLPRLKKNLSKNLRKDPIVLPMIILLKTKMRVGNEMHYLHTRHKGLTTLKKKNIKISGNNVTFRFIAKDGVPLTLVEKFSLNEINELRKLLKTKKENDFVFVNSSGRPLKDIAFEKAFDKYCGKKFYPHIVRSHYATMEAKKFLKKHKFATKQETKKLYMDIADKLGHRKFSKKKNEWLDAYEVTLHHYIQPEIVEEISKITKELGE
ncbi:MAG: hypothetical protein ABIF88_03260 [archaeon]